MRRLLFAALYLAPCLAVAAEPVERSETALDLDGAVEFQLGGAATRHALTPPVEGAPAVRLSLPQFTDPAERAQAQFGATTVFVDDNALGNPDAVTLGTFVSSGPASAGVAFTYLDEGEALQQSELFVDFAVTEGLTVGVSGILNSEDDDAPVRQYGISAEYAMSPGSFLQGGVANAEESDPVFGLSVGFKF